MREITRAEIGPNTDLIEAAIALAHHLWRAEGREMVEASEAADAWRDGTATTDMLKRYPSAKAARRATEKARRRLAAAALLFELVKGRQNGTVHILRTIEKDGADTSGNAPQSPLVRLGETITSTSSHSTSDDAGNVLSIAMGLGGP